MKVSFHHGLIIIHSAATTIQPKQRSLGKSTWIILSRRELCLGSGDCVGRAPFETYSFIEAEF